MKLVVATWIAALLAALAGRALAEAATPNADDARASLVANVPAR